MPSSSNQKFAAVKGTTAKKRLSVEPSLELEQDDWFTPLHFTFDNRLQNARSKAMDLFESSAFGGQDLLLFARAEPHFSFSCVFDIKINNNWRHFCIKPWAWTSFCTPQYHCNGPCTNPPRNFVQPGNVNILLVAVMLCKLMTTSRSLPKHYPSWLHLVPPWCV